ncbi:MAG: apolipoprotein N-acyltransferase [Alphaproteobacteria bacterium]|nr:MAG: apolipoprotein N-acyltransferase [Alphaproteobacteria bacterium]
MRSFTSTVGNWIRGYAHKPIGVWVMALGALMTLGYAPFHIWPLAVASLAGLWWLVKNAQSRKQVLGATLVWGMGHQLTALYWLPWAFFKDSGGSWLSAIGGGVPAVVGLALYGSLAFMIAALLAWQTGRRWNWYAGATVFVLAWVTLEFVKGLHPMGFPWLPLGAMWAYSVPLMQGAALGGVWLLSTLILTFAMLMHGGRRGVTAACALLVIVWGVGLYRVANMTVASKAERGNLIRVVQPNIQSAHKWDAQLRWQFLQETMQVALAGDPSMTTPPTVIMPETAVAFYLDREEDVRRALTDQIAARMPQGSGLVTGTVHSETDAAGVTHYFNSMAVMDTRGVLRSRYDKRLLVPFGEYIPARSWLEALPMPMTLRTFSQSRIDFTHGNRSGLLPTPAGYGLALICYEGIFPLQVGLDAPEARYLINITNDGWFTGTIALYQHAALTRLRAVETGLPVVRAANTGITLVFDGLGREIGRLPINTATYMDIVLPEPLEETPFLKMLHRLFG